MQRTNLNMLQFPNQLNAAVTQTNMYATKIEQLPERSLPSERQDNCFDSDEPDARTVEDSWELRSRNWSFGQPQCGDRSWRVHRDVLNAIRWICTLHRSAQIIRPDAHLVNRATAGFGRVREKALLMKLAVDGASRPGTSAA